MSYWVLRCAKALWCCVYIRAIVRSDGKLSFEEFCAMMPKK